MTTQPYGAADDLVWALLFIAIGSILAFNAPSDAAWPLILAAVAYVAGAVFAYRLLIRR